MFDDLAKRLRGFEATALDRVQCETILGELARLDATTEAARLRVTSRLVELSKATASVFPEHSIAQASRRGLNDAVRTTERAATVEAMAPMGAALADGSITTGHVDVVTRQLRHLEPRQRSILTTNAPHLAHIAANTTVREFDRHVQREVRSLTTDDGCARLERQRRATHLRTWTDRDSGMICLRGELDPENGLRFVARLDAAVEALFARAVPDTCPSDPVAKNDHLRGLALMAITGDQPTAIGPPRAEISVLVDLQTLTEGLHARSIVDVGADTSVPVETVRRWACDAQLLPVVLGGDGVVLDVGRARRLATANQRRAIRAMYPTCAIPGCDVSHAHCQPHHIHWWRHGGGTEMANLVPLCNRHHHAVHEGGWRLALDMPERQLTVRRPDGTTLTTGPPLARAG